MYCTVIWHCIIQTHLPYKLPFSQLSVEIYTLRKKLVFWICTENGYWGFPACPSEGVVRVVWSLYYSDILEKKSIKRIWLIHFDRSLIISSVSNDYRVWFLTKTLVWLRRMLGHNLLWIYWKWTRKPRIK